MDQQQIAYAIGGMLECALWSSTDFDGEPLDAAHGIQDIHPDTTASLIEDLRDFIEANSDDIAASGLDAAQVGHDFTLTRNGHGTGIWDRGLGELGDRLADAMRAYGSFDLWVDSEGKINI